MRCILVVTVLVAAAGAASVSQRVSVSGTSSRDGSVSVSETSSSINSDRGATLGTRSSFSSNRRQPVSTGTALRQTPVTGTGTGTGLLAAQAPVSGRVPTVPVVRPLKPLNIHVPSLHVPSLAPLGSSIGTRFNNRGAGPASAPAVAPALFGAQATLQQAAHKLSAVMSSLGV